MCFRPPSAEAGESPCPHCYMIGAPDAQGNCQECGKPMGITNTTGPTVSSVKVPPSSEPPQAPPVPGQKGGPLT